MHTTWVSPSLRGAALAAAVAARARKCGYTVVYRTGPETARAVDPDGSYRDGRLGDFGFVPNT